VDVKALHLGVKRVTHLNGLVIEESFIDIDLFSE